MVHAVLDLVTAFRVDQTLWWQVAGNPMDKDMIRFRNHGPSGTGGPVQDRPDPSGGLTADLRQRRQLKRPDVLVAAGAFLVGPGAGVLAVLPAAHAHDWYPIECCGGGDCAPADGVVRRDDGSYLLKARGMSIIVPADYPYWRRSPDERIHVCIRRFTSDDVLICAFRGPGT
jgi:hypothetical protein